MNGRMKESILYRDALRCTTYVVNVIKINIRRCEWKIVIIIDHNFLFNSFSIGCVGVRVHLICGINYTSYA